jgi:hypothetical protein
VLKNLQIVGFRGIQKLSFGSLARVNLIVGKNNTGKTAVLEAVELLSIRAGEAWVRSPLRRGEWHSRFEEFKRALEIRHLFNGRSVDFGSKFAINADSDGNTFVPRKFWVWGQIVRKVEEGTLRDAPAPSVPAPEQLGLKISRAACEPDEMMPISSEGWTWVDRFASLPCKVEQDGLFPVIFVSADSLSGDELLSLWDEARLEDRVEPVLQGLKAVFPNIDRLGPLGTENGTVRGNTFSVRLVGEKNYNPIGSLGDGVRRLFAVLLAVSEARGGCILIDDIDTGLHHSTMREMWQLVVQTAEQLNIQVFATTHSSDCWRSLGYLCASDPEIAKQVSVHRLERGLDHTIQYTPEELAVAAQQDIDIR